MYQSIAADLLLTGNEMLFIAGPRQVGKTSMAQALSSEFSVTHYLNWDELPTEILLTQGNYAIGQHLKLDQLTEKKPLVIFEEPHKDDLLSDSLGYYQKQTKAPHAFQVVIDLPYQEMDCFSYHEPVVVPSKTFLSQLLYPPPLREQGRSLLKSYTV